MRLEDVCTVFTDGDWIESKDQSEKGIRLIQTENIGEGLYLEKESRAKYISEDTFKKLKCTEIFPGDILVSRLPEPIGRACIVPERTGRMITAVDCTICRPDETLISKEYLCYFMQSNAYYTRLLANVTGTTRKRISRKNLGNVELEVPTKEEQNTIVERLDCLVKVIDSRTKELQLLDNLIKARFVEMFGDPKYNKSDLVKIGEIGALTSGGTPSRAKPEYFEGDIRWYSAGELNSLYLPDSVEHISQMALQQSSAKLFNKGTLMIGMYDTAAFKMGILTEDSSSNQACANLNPRQGFNIVWLYYLFDIMKPVFLQERQGVRQKNLSLSKIKEFEVPFAPFELQNQFADFVKQVDKSKVINVIFYVIFIYKDVGVKSPTIVP